MAWIKLEKSFSHEKFIKTIVVLNYQSIHHNQEGSKEKRLPAIDLIYLLKQTALSLPLNETFENLP